MFKSTLVISVLALVSLGWQKRDDPAPMQLKEEAITIEYTASSGEAVVRMCAESEARLESVAIRKPGGAHVFHMRAGDGHDLALSGFIIETREFMSPALFKVYTEGEYDMRARTVDGRPALGQATLSHHLPRAPMILYPAEGEVNVPTNLLVTWVPDNEADGYRVIMEQGENDGLTVELPPGSSSFRVPQGVLAAGTVSQLEVGAIGSNGNCTLVEVVFTTR